DLARVALLAEHGTALQLAERFRVGDEEPTVGADGYSADIARVGAALERPPALRIPDRDPAGARRRDNSAAVRRQGRPRRRRDARTGHLDKLPRRFERPEACVSTAVGREQPLTVGAVADAEDV